MGLTHPKSRFESSSSAVKALIDNGHIARHCLEQKRMTEARSSASAVSASTCILLIFLTQTKSKGGEGGQGVNTSQ